MKNLRNLALLGAVVVASASFASADTISPYGEISFSGEGSLSGTAGSLLTLTLSNSLVTPGTVTSAADLGVASGSFSAFPTAPDAPPQLTIFAFTSPIFPASLFTTTYGTVTATFDPTTFISSDITIYGSSELIEGIFFQTGYAATYEVLDLTSNGKTFTADLVPATLPEPTSLVLLGTGLLCSAGFLFRRRGKPRGNRRDTIDSSGQ